MKYYDQNLQDLQNKLAQQKQFIAKKKELQLQQVELTEKVEKLKKFKTKEQADVERLEKGGLSFFFYEVLGKSETQMEKEKKEAYEAMIKFDFAQKELEDVCESIQFTTQKIEQLKDCEDAYQKALKEKALLLKEPASPASHDILKIEEQLGFLNHQTKEINEAIHAGQRAYDATEDVLSSLQSAAGWGTWDLIGGGLVSTAMKHSHMDDAEEKLQHVQKLLRNFKTELADIQIDTSVEISMHGFLRFADYFFDGLIMDWTALNQIENAKSSVEKTKNQIQSVMAQLQTLRLRVSDSIKETTEKRNDLLLTTPV